MLLARTTAASAKCFKIKLKPVRYFFRLIRIFFVLVVIFFFICYYLVCLCVNSGMIVASTLSRISLDPEIIDATISFMSVFLTIVFSISVMPFVSEALFQIEFLINAGTDKGFSYIYFLSGVFLSFLVAHKTFLSYILYIGVFLWLCLWHWVRVFTVKGK